MSKLKRLKHLIEYFALVLFRLKLFLLGWRVSHLLAKFLASVGYHAVPIRKKVARTNLTRAFPELTSNQINKILFRTYQQFAQTFVEILLLPKLSAEKIRQMVTITNPGVLEEARATGAILVGAHFGNWELMGIRLALDYPVDFVIGQQENIRTDELLNLPRKIFGIGLIPLKNALRQVIGSLKDKRYVAILADQDAHENGEFVPFFGQLASTPKGPAVFARHSQVPIIVGTIIRERPDKFRIFLDRITPPTVDNFIQEYTAAYTQKIEYYCRQYPDHWFWFHRRWKTRPANT